jgi:hypothetical protein
MPNYAVRGIYTIFALGGAALLFARGIAYWLEWQPWTVRWLGIAALLLGTLGVFTEIGAAAGLKALAAVVIVCVVYIWQDVGLERREAEEKAREEDESLR